MRKNTIFARMIIEPVHNDISLAKTLDKRIYLDSHIFELLKEKVFNLFWHYIGDKSYLNSQHNLYPFTLLENYLNEPLVLSSDVDNNIYCLSNVCNHRGSILVKKECQAPHIRCSYHGRMFKLNGQFVSMPEFKKVQHFSPENNHLPSLPIKNLGDMLFTSLNPAFNFERVFNEIVTKLDWYPFDQLKLCPNKPINSFFVKANWALYCENYLEGFHIPFIHPVLNSFIDFKTYTTEIFEFSNVQLGKSKSPSDCFDNIPPDNIFYNQNIAAFYFWVFPNLMINIYPWGISLNEVIPIDLNNTKVNFISYIFDQSKRGQGAGGDLNTVQQEDEEIVELVQKGIRSSFYKHGRYSPDREQGTHHFHRLLAEFLNK
ncbi:MAG: Rieske 2Fe-2S domain-containing protein [Sediminibacterium sp.]|nr:Rieske 2Fe-2S domain-containing protein [Sediminibacterium sp.]